MLARTRDAAIRDLRASKAQVRGAAARDLRSYLDELGCCLELSRALAEESHQLVCWEEAHALVESAQIKGWAAPLLEAWAKADSGKRSALLYALDGSGDYQAVELRSCIESAWQDDSAPLRFQAIQAAVADPEAFHTILEEAAQDKDAQIRQALWVRGRALAPHALLQQLASSKIGGEERAESILAALAVICWAFDSSEELPRDAELLSRAWAQVGAWLAAPFALSHDEDTLEVLRRAVIGPHHQRAARVAFEWHHKARYRGYRWELLALAVQGEYPPSVDKLDRMLSSFWPSRRRMALELVEYYQLLALLPSLEARKARAGREEKKRLQLVIDGFAGQKANNS